MPIKVVATKKSGNSWDVVVKDEVSEEITPLATDVPYQVAYRTKLEAQRRAKACQLIVPRRHSITI